MFVRWKRRQLAACLPTREYIGPPYMEIPAWARYIKALRGESDERKDDLYLPAHEAVEAEKSKPQNWRYVRPAGIHDYALYAYLCESKRLGSKVQSRTITYLASIVESESMTSLEENDHGFGLRRLGFWLSANTKLNSMNLTPEMHAKLLHELSTKVAPISDKDVAYIEKQDALNDSGKAKLARLLEQQEQAHAA